MTKKVLYVEDEPFLSRIVSDGLKKSGYNVKVISDGSEVVAAFSEMLPDICLLDIMLPNIDGYVLAKKLRKDHPDLPIIFLSAKILTEDVINGFKAGGNDYMKKPFSMDELLVRMEALLSRISGDRHLEKEKITIHVFGGCRLDTISQKLYTSNGTNSLSFKECALLEMLIIHKNNVLERHEVLLKIWGDDSFYNTRSMDVFMTHIRKLLKDEAAIEIMNLRGIGYKLICK